MSSGNRGDSGKVGGAPWGTQGEGHFGVHSCNTLSGPTRPDWTQWGKLLTLLN